MAGGDFGGFERVLRVGEGRRLKRLRNQAEYIGTLEPELEKLSDEELKGKTAEYRQRVANGETLEDSSSRRSPPFAKRSSARWTFASSTSR